MIWVKCCVSCLKKYVLDRIDAQCMKCLQPYSYAVIVQLFGMKFIHTKYKSKRAIDLLELERAHLQKLQSELEIVADIWNRQFNFSLFDSLKLVKSLKRRDLFNRVLSLYDITFPNGTSVREPVPEKMIKCQNCPGFAKMLDGNYYCFVCNFITCRSCRESLNDHHVCDPNAVKSIQFLERDTKPCPKCGTQIHKIDGCDQMWDPQCQTAFSWKTLEIARDRIHNPHYYEYMRAHGGMPQEHLRFNQEIEGQDCQDRIPEFVSINPYIDSFHIALDNTVWYQENQTNHIRAMDRNLLKLRIKYLFEIISESEFCRKIQKIDYKNAYFHEIQSIFNPYQSGLMSFSSHVSMNDVSLN